MENNKGKRGHSGHGKQTARLLKAEIPTSEIA